MNEEHRLIVGLGNPGLRYRKTRHNLGWMVVAALAGKNNLSFKKESRLEAQVAHLRSENGSTHLLLPETYMNLSGRAVRGAMDVWKIRRRGLLVVLDDVAIPFGTMRIREKGGTGGHNGLLSIDEMLKSQDYARLRMGIGLPQDPIPLEAYVLRPFSEEEREALPEFIEGGVSVIESWCEGSLQKAQELTSSLRKSSEEKNDEKRK